MDQNFLSVMTETEAADFLGVPVEAVALWARGGQLRVAARSEAGQLLFYRWRVEQDGAALAAFAPIHYPAGDGRTRQKPASSKGRILDCGCRLAPAPGRLCRTGAALLAAAALAEDIAESAPDDPFLSRLAALCRDALARHLAGPPRNHRDPDPAPRFPPEVVAVIDRLEGRDPDDFAAEADRATAKTAAGLADSISQA
jgi:hypothetical protein